MFLEYWMIGVFLIVSTYFMYRLYMTGLVEGARLMTSNVAEATLTALENNKIIQTIEDENGELKIIPGDIDEFIKQNEK